jgi:type VI secretion system protein ImpF
MATSKQQSDSFLPALLDRLSIHNKGPMNRNTFRDTVLRDLSWLLNCTNLERQLPLDNYPHVKSSVINFGIPPLAGARFTASELEAVAEQMQQRIAFFEPRILEKTLKVSVIREIGGNEYNHAHFRIEVTFWFEPYPIDMVIRAKWDMETGGVEIQEYV